MNFNSIITKIIFIFIISIALFVAVFIAYFNYEKEELTRSIKERYIVISKHIQDNRFRFEEIVDYTKNLELQIEEEPKEVFEKSRVMASGPGFEVFEIEDNFYMHLHGPGFRMMFKDIKKYEKKYFGFWILGIIFLVFCFSFLWIIKALLPLKQLKEKVELLASGNLDIDCKSDKKDEIAQLSNEFDNAIKKISLLLESRQLFLRTVMHEIKTPIAKGRIIGELIDDEKQKNRVIGIFEKLNYLVDDFAKIEELISGNYSINKNPTTINFVIENAIDMMMIDKIEDKIKLVNISRKKIDVDSTLISMAIKNLIDNGLKYSDDKKVLIEEKENQLIIISKGNELAKPLENYFKPFHNDTRSKNHGMGLGLYIVYSILQMHNMNLKYKYSDNKNTFIINF